MAVEIPNFQIPHVEAGVAREEKFQLAIAGGIREALAIIDQTFEHTPFPANQLFFHTRPHTRGVIARTDTILSTIQQTNADAALVTDRDRALGRFAAAWHDSVQHPLEPSVVLDSNGVAVQKRKRAFGDNEKDSALLAEGYMRKVNEHMGDVFTEEDIQMVRGAILITVPDYAGGTVVQPSFAAYRDTIVAQAVALADLGGAGMEGFSTERWQSDALFIEENVDFAAYRRVYQGAARDRRLASFREPETEGRYHTRMIAWFTAQIAFMTAREVHLEEELDAMNIDGQTRQHVRQLFHHYDEVRSEIASLLVQRQGMSFREWMSELDFSLEHPPQYHN